MIKSLLLKFLFLIIRYSKLNDERVERELINPQITQKIKYVFEYIQEYYYKTLNISELAGIAQMIVPYFCNRFK